MAVVFLDIYAGPTPNGTLLVTLTDDDIGDDFEMRDGENSLGSGSFSIRRDHASATEANLATGNYVKVRIPIIDTDPVFGFWIDEHDDTILAYDEEGAEVLTRQGPGTLAILARAKFLEDNWATVPPATATRGTNVEVPGFWRWTHQPYGAIFKRFIEEGQNEPGEPLGDVTTDFDRDDDSDATPWPEIVRDVRFPIGTDGLELLQAFAQTGELYVRSTPDLLVSAHQARGTDRTSGTFASGKVRLVKGVNINTDLSRSGQGILKATHALVVGSDFKYRRVVSPDYTTGTGRWITVDYPESNDNDVLDKVGLEELARGEAQQNAVTLEIKAGDDEAAGLYLPYLHFKTGDLVTLDTGSAAWDYDETDQRVTGFTIGIREASDDVTDDMAARSLVVSLELGGSPAGRGFGDLSGPGRSFGVSDGFFELDPTDIVQTDGSAIKFVTPYKVISAHDNNDDNYAFIYLENDAFLVNMQDGTITTPYSGYSAIDMFPDGMYFESDLFNFDINSTADDGKYWFNEGLGIVFPHRSSDPASGDPSEEGQLYWNTATKKFRWHDGTIWQDVGTSTGFTPVTVYAESNSPGTTSATPNTLTEVPFDTFYDVDAVDLSGVLPAGLGLTYTGADEFEATEDGVWVVGPGVDLVTNPGVTGRLVLGCPSIGYNPNISVVAAGNPTDWVIDRTISMRTGQSFRLLQSASGASATIINGYALMNITRIAGAVS